MLLSITSFGLLALLFLAQSRPAISDFVCNDRKIRDATQGFCLGFVDPNDNNPHAGSDASNTFLLMPAIRHKSSEYFKGYGTFTCDGVLISNSPVKWRFCCDYKNKPAKEAFPVTYRELNRHCISRD